jgi:hypothetical protein
MNASFLNDKLKINDDVIDVNQDEHLSDTNIKFDDISMYINTFVLLMRDHHITVINKQLKHNNDTLNKLINYKNKEDNYEHTINNTKNVLKDGIFDYEQQIRTKQHEIDGLKKKYTLEKSTSYFASLKNNNNIALIDKKTKAIDEDINILTQKYNKYKQSLEQYNYETEHETETKIKKYTAFIRFSLTFMKNNKTFIQNINNYTYISRKEIDRSIKLINYSDEDKKQLEYIKHEKVLTTIKNNTELKNMFSSDMFTRLFMCYITYYANLDLNYNCELLLYSWSYFFLASALIFNTNNYLFDNNSEVSIIIPVLDCKTFLIDNPITKDIVSAIKTIHNDNIYNKFILIVPYINIISSLYSLTNDIKYTALITYCFSVGINCGIQYIRHKFVILGA